MADLKSFRAINTLWQTLALLSVCLLAYFTPPSFMRNKPPAMSHVTFPERVSAIEPAQTLFEKSSTEKSNAIPSKKQITIKEARRKNFMEARVLVNSIYAAAASKISQNQIIDEQMEKQMCEAMYNNIAVSFGCGKGAWNNDCKSLMDSEVPPDKYGEICPLTLKCPPEEVIGEHQWLKNLCKLDIDGDKHISDGEAIREMLLENSIREQTKNEPTQDEIWQEYIRYSMDPNELEYLYGASGITWKYTATARAAEENEKQKEEKYNNFLIEKKKLLDQCRTLNLDNIIQDRAVPTQDDREGLTFITGQYGLTDDEQVKEKMDDGFATLDEISDNWDECFKNQERCKTWFGEQARRTNNFVKASLPYVEGTIEIVEFHAQAFEIGENAAHLISISQGVHHASSGLTALSAVPILGAVISTFTLFINIKHANTQIKDLHKTMEANNWPTYEALRAELGRANMLHFGMDVCNNGWTYADWNRYYRNLEQILRNNFGHLLAAMEKKKSQIKRTTFGIGLAMAGLAASVTALLGAAAVITAPAWLPVAAIGIGAVGFVFGISEFIKHEEHHQSLINATQ